MKAKHAKQETIKTILKYIKNIKNNSTSQNRKKSAIYAVEKILCVPSP
jgi:hypothetical protein